MLSQRTSRPPLLLCGLGYRALGCWDVAGEDGGHLASGNHGERASEYHSFQYIEKGNIYCQQWLQIYAEETPGPLEDSELKRELHLRS